MCNSNQSTSQLEWHELQAKYFPMMLNQLASLSRNRELPLEGLNLSHTPHTWDAYFLPAPEKQVLTPPEVKAACAAIRENVRLGVSGNTEINFVEFSQGHNGDSYNFGDAIFMYLPLGGFYHPEEMVICSFSELYHHDMRVLIGDYNGATRAFMEAKSDEREDYIGELSEVYMLSTVMSDACHLGIITMFNKGYGGMDFNVMDL